MTYPPSPTLARETPVSVSAGCADAILRRRKTMLRQVAHQPGAPCPLGAPGDSLWVREPWAHAGHSGFRYLATDSDPASVVWLPARDMPCEASRLRLVIREIRSERLQDIAGHDFTHEGLLWRQVVPPTAHTDRSGFAAWWDSLHPRPGTRWRDNPHVWVVGFELVEHP